MLKQSRLVVVGLSVIALAFLAACSQTRPTGSVGQVPGDGQQRASGLYKVGEPYQINGVWYYPAEDYGYVESGIASFYGGETSGVNFHGRYTANGEVYDMNALTAAHQTLPMPSLVRVTNLENGRSLVLRVNDRGPFARGRIVDVSRRSAQLLGFAEKGTARVKVEILAEESRSLKLALLNNQQGPDRDRTVVAAVPREAVASDVLPPPPGARTEVQSQPAAALPPPGSLMPSRTSTPAMGGQAPVRLRQAAPIVAEDAPGPPPPALPPRATTRPAPAPELPVAALPVAQQLTATPAIGQSPVQATSIFVQAGAFANYDNAYRVSARLSRYGQTKVVQSRVNGLNLYRVRVGPAQSVEEGDRLLEQVASLLPEARLVVD